MKLRRKARAGSGEASGSTHPQACLATRVKAWNECSKTIEFMNQLSRKRKSRGRAMVGTWLAGQRPGPAEPAAGTARLCDIRVEGRSVSGLRPDSLHPVPCIGWAAHTAAHCACCWGSWLVLAGSTARVALLGRQHTSMPSGSGMLPGPALRAPRARRGHRALGLVVPYPVGFACP